MKQLKQLLLVMAIALTGFTPAQAQTTPFNHYSEWMANSRKSYVYNGDYWRYDDGLMYESILDTYHRYNGNPSFLEGVQNYLKGCFNKETSPYIGNLNDGDLDDMRPGRLVWKYKRTYGHSDSNVSAEKYEAALTALMGAPAFSNDSRVNQTAGNPWRHKSGLTNQVWLDGIFMGLPFWTLAGPVIGSSRSEYSGWGTANFYNDAVSQIQKTDEKTYEPTIGLWAHAWDADGDEYWSTKTGAFLTGTFKNQHAAEEEVAHDGRSSHCWGRALGWYAMAIMETMDNIAAVNGAADSRITTLKALFKKVMDKVVETRDPSEGVWYCVLDVGDNSSATSPYYGIGSKNNYLEATCSSMFAYCLLHGVAQGYLDNSYKTIAQDVYNSVVTQFIRPDGDNIKLIDCDKVAGLGNNGSTNRDGSFAYYMSESKIENDSKGVGPFIWASLAAETTHYNYTIATGFPSIANDGIVQFRWSRVADDFTVPNTTPASFVSPTFTAKTYGNDTPLTNSSNITFVSDNTKVATVDANGNITLAGEAGTANIKATMKSDAYVYAGEAIYTVTTTGTDTTKPTLSSSTPATGATDVAVSGNIVLTFNEAVTIADASKITLNGGAGTLDKEHATTDGATITIPYSGLANSTDYTLNIAAGAFEDLSNNTNDAISAITFRTIAPDETAPTLSSQSIANNAPNVSTSGTIVLTFSEDVACTTNATLTPAGGSAINLTPSVSGSTVTYSYSGLSNETSYTFNLDANSVADLSGNKYASAISFSFTTGAAPTHTASDPAVVDKSNTGTYGNKIFLDVANTESNTTITTGNVSCLTYNWKDSNNKNWYEGGTSGTNTETWSGFVNEGFPDGSSISSASVQNSSNIRYYYVTGTTGVAILGKSNNDTDRKLQLIVEEVAENGVLTAKGTTAERLNKTIGVLEHSFSMDATKYYRITIKGSSNDNGRLCAIRFKQGSSTPAEDTTPPTVTMTTPSATTDVAINTSSVVLTVSEEVTAVGEDIAGTFNGSDITFTRTDATHLTYNLPDLTNSTTYNIQLNANQIQDAAGNKNAETSFSFTTVAAEQEQVATPSISGNTSFTDNTSVTITCTTTGATIHYTIDGSTPTASSTTYSSPIAISATTTVKAIAIKSGMTDSEVASKTFTKSSGGGSKSVTIGRTYDLSTHPTTFSIVSEPNVSVTQFDGSGLMATENKTIYVKGQQDTNIPNDVIYRTKVNNTNVTNFNSSVYAGFRLKINEGYSISVSSIDAEMGTTANTSHKIVIVNESGTTLYESNNYTFNNYNSSSNVTNNIVSIKPTSLNLNGDVYVRIHYWGSDGGKYVVPLSLTITGDLSNGEESTPSTYSITLDKNGGTTDGNATATEGSNKLTDITAPAWDGHTITGFYKEATCTNLIADAEGNLQSSTDYTDENGNWTSTSAQTLYAKWLTENDATFNDGSYTIGETALDLSSLFSSTSNGAVTYTITNANGTGATIEGTLFTATTTGTVTVKATQAATATYAGTEKTATITVYTNPLGTHTITYTLDVTSSEDKEKVDINSTNASTSANLNTLVGITNNTGDDYTKGSKANLTVKIPTDASYNADHYMSVGFTVASGYTFTPTSISVKAQPVTTAKTVKLVLTDGINTIEKTSENLTAGTISTFNPTISDATTLTGNVTLKIYCYGATDTYRLGSPITIEGTVTEAFTPITTTISSAKYATYVTPAAIDFTQTEGITAFKVTATSPTFILTEVNDAPANTPVVLKGEANTYTLHRATEDLTSSFANNQLRASDGTVVGDESTIYVLGKVNGVVGFGKLKSGTILAAGKAYLLVSAQQARNFYSFNDAEIEQPITTGLNGFSSEGLLIDDDTPLYNLSGQRVSKSYKGIVIINGKKVLRK